MSESHLCGCRILVVEDEYLLADELSAELAAAGVIVLGPTGSLRGALRLIDAEPRIDGAILDVNLSGEMAFAAADRLSERAVPFVFTTGYDASAIPPRFRHIERCEKPIDVLRVARAIGRVIDPDGEAAG